MPTATLPPEEEVLPPVVPPVPVIQPPPIPVDEPPNYTGQVPEAALPPTWAPPPVDNTFTADDNLINSEIMPEVDPRVTAQQTAGDAGLAAQDRAPDIPVPGADPRLMRFQSMTDDLLQQMRTQPDRLGMAKSYYDTFSKQTEGDFDRSLQEATNLGAARGRLGSGILTNSYGDLAERRLRDKEAAKERFLNEATEGTIRDRQQLWENMSAAERNAFGEAGANTDELQQEREARRGLISEHYGQADRAIAQGRNDRDEQRGERSYQGGLAEQALQRRIMQQLAEGSMDETQFNQAMRLFGAGNTNDPTGAYGEAADRSAIEAAAAAGDVALLMRLLAGRTGQETAARG